MVAGFDTTANTLAFTVYYLALHPEAQEKSRQEVLEVCGEDGVRIVCF
jgi:cytochrome P450